MLLPRVLTAIVGIPVLLFLIHWGGLTYASFIVAVTALSLYEYGLILRLGGHPAQRVVVLVAGAGLAACQALNFPLGAAVTLILSVIMLREMASSHRSLERGALTLLGAFLLGWMPAHLTLIRDLRPYGEMLTLMLFVSVWIMDTAAYAAGHAIGKRKLAPELSPKKTWEGAIAGFLAAMGTVFVFRALVPRMLSAPRAVLVGSAIGICGQLSDLAESLIKRAVGVKDSSTVLPGHGGVMDRFDSFILAAPVVYYCLVLI
jgi:phosphatidate cytidylyltransferase